MAKHPEIPYCTSREAAKLLGVSLSTVQRWTESGLLEAWKTRGGHRRISRTSVQHFAKGQGTASRPAVPVPGDVALDRITILIVEDDIVLCKLYKTVIASWNLAIDTITAANGAEGLIHVGRDAPDLMIADLRMPVMDGFQLVNNLACSSFRGGMEIVIVTGLDEQFIAQRGGLPEGIRILSKPAPFATLHSICTGILERRTAYLEPDCIQQSAARPATQMPWKGNAN